MNYRLFLLLLIIPFSFTAQVTKIKATIFNAGSLYSTYDFEADAGSLKKAIALQGGSKILPDIVKYSNEKNWPEGISNFSSRQKQQKAILKYKVYKIVATPDYCIVVVPASENKHMEASMRPSRDIYFIMELKGVEFEGNAPVAATEEYAADEEDTRVYIIDPGQLYSTFDLQSDQDARDIMVDSGILSEEEYALLATLVKEDSWPSGISTLDARTKTKGKMKDYVAYFAAVFGGETGEKYTLIWIPQAENAHMPKDMQPLSETGIYFVMKSDGVEYR